MMNMSNQLCHYGILGMKWGVRRYQNKDGSLTPAGKARLKITDYEKSICILHRRYWSSCYEEHNNAHG